MKRKLEMRKAFSMITAIFVIVLMALVSVMVLNLTGKMTRETTIQFVREQSELLAKSYTEYAIMAVTANDQNDTTRCLDDIRGKHGLYSVDVNISYIGQNNVSSGCKRRLSNTVQTVTTPLSIIVDVFVRYQEPDADKNITYHRRSLQKI